MQSGIMICWTFAKHNSYSVAILRTLLSLLPCLLFIELDSPPKAAARQKGHHKGGGKGGENDSWVGQRRLRRRKEGILAPYLHYIPFFCLSRNVIVAISPTKISLPAVHSAVKSTNKILAQVSQTHEGNFVPPRPSAWHFPPF